MNRAGWALPNEYGAAPDFLQSGSMARDHRLLKRQDLIQGQFGQPETKTFDVVCSTAFGMIRPESVRVECACS